MVFDNVRPAVPESVPAPRPPMPTTDVSVIIPTHNRANILGRALDAVLAALDAAAFSAEILVVDDGSDDGTPDLLEALRRSWPGLVVLTQPNRGQAVARNLAFSRATGRLFVLLGDDIVPEPGFFTSHWEAFTACDRPETFAAIGHTDWHPEVARTPFREWSNDCGLQFGYGLIAGRADLDFRFFYTSNLSFSRALYDRCGGFDERFREYGWEDVELGFRYQAAGMSLRYLPAAQARHLHPLTLRDFCARRIATGRSAVVCQALHPELAGVLGVRQVGRWWGLAPSLLTPITTVLTALDLRGIDVNLPARAVLRAHYLAGLLEGQRVARRGKSGP